jgi:predicted Zn-dependent peptidase
VTQDAFQHRFANGLTLLAEPMPHVRSAAMYFLVPAGCVHDPAGKSGLAGIVAGMMARGAGDRDNRALMLAQDKLGLDRSESVGVVHMQFWGGTVAKNLPAGMEIFADVLRRPTFPAEELEPIQALALQEIKGLEDEPTSRLMLELRKRLYPTPLCNDHRGTIEGVESVTLADVKAFHARHFKPAGTIVAVAGNIDWPQIREQVERLFGDWKGTAPAAPPLGPEPSGHSHLSKELEQTHIALAYPSVPVDHPDYYQALGAVNVLSGGMGARLFTEIREKEGLCYSVSASYMAMKGRGAIRGYAASLNHQAQRTFDKLVEELCRLPNGISEEEVDRVKVGLKTSLIMRQESTSSRALALASDWYYLGRVQSFDEIQSRIDGLTAKSILDHLRKTPPRDFRVVTIGPEALNTSAV